jgi:hypothetical protein
MDDEAGGWAAALGISDAEAADFEKLIDSMGSTPQKILRAMIGEVLAIDRKFGAYGLRGMANWITERQATESVVDHAMAILPLDIRETGFMWPPGKPFPWTADQCKAALLGYEVRWTGDFDDFLNHLRGKWEMSAGYAFLYQS